MRYPDASRTGARAAAVGETLHYSGSHPSLERVFIDMERELTYSIDIVENPPS